MGLDFDDHGQGFLTTSVVEHLWHLVPGAHYQRWKNRSVHPNPHVYEAMSATSDHLHWESGTRDKASKQAEGNQDFGGGHSHCDAMIYLGDRWPDEYRGTLLTSNIHGRRVNRDRLIRQSGPFRGVHADDFLVANDPWFRAVSMEYGPDGDVYLTDWSDNGECHDRDGVHRTSGRIYKITWGDPIRVSVNLNDASTKQLIDYQLHRNDWFVRHARRILQERAAAGQEMSAVHAELQEMFEKNPDLTRKLRALWALHSSGGLNKQWLLDLLSHKSEHVRAWAVRLLVDDRDQIDVPLRQLIGKRFAEMAGKEKSWLVRMALASGVQRLPVGNRWPVTAHLTSELSKSIDPNLERMIWYAMEPEVAADPQRAMKFAELVTPRIRRWMARRVTEESDHAIMFLFDALARTRRSDVLADLLDGFNAGLIGMKFDTLPESSYQILRKLIEHENKDVRVAATIAAAAVGDEATLQQIRYLLHDAATDIEIRQASLTGLARRNPSGFSKDLQRLIAAGQLTSAALRAGVAVNDPAFAKTVLDRYTSFSKDDRIAAVDLLVARRDGARLLISAIEQKTIAAADLSVGQARQIEALGDVKIRERLERFWGTVRQSSGDRLRQIKILQRTLDPSRNAPADLANGREVFKKMCASCHKLFNEGRTIGPELTGANRRNLHYLLSSVIDPSATVPADFRLAIVVTNNGRVITGAISQRTDLALTIQTATGEVQITSENIDTVNISPKSMMPDGLLDKLSQEQIRDLFAWMMGPGLVTETSERDGSLVSKHSPAKNTTARPADEADFISLFNGKNFDGWDSKPGAWEVIDGEIWCTGVSKEKNWLIWRREQPADFVLRLEFRWDQGNSGVQVRSEDLGKWMVHGYQVEIAQQSMMGLWHHSLLDNDHPKKQARHLMATAGQSVLLAEDGSKSVKQIQDAKRVKANFKEHAWNSMEIIANGDMLVQKINGVVFSTVVDRDKKMRRGHGFIALQDHGKDCKVAFRNIRLRQHKVKEPSQP